jgi:acyl phosphate:glycerol-3-phosphate acyltransferase
MAPALLGYFLGSLPLGFLIARGRGGVDVRRVGSGNVGAANVYRSAGRWLGVLVLFVDMAKGAGTALLAGTYFAASHEHAGALAGLAAVVGHIYPVWLRFVGGKGVAVAFGVFAVLAPIATAIAATVFVAATWVTRYVSLGSVLATVTLPAMEWSLGAPDAVSLAASGVAALILFRHRGNIARLARGTERRLGQRAIANS